MPPPVSITQSSSPFFRLPAELRQLIWEEVLAPPEGAQPAHFHIYDKVYDSCLYDCSTAVPSDKRIEARSTALLRTCRRIHSEAVQALYDSTDFYVVLLSGYARPERIAERDTPDASKAPSNIDKRTCLGRLETCAQLNRIRRLKLVIQPGWHPNVSKYRKRVASFLQVIEAGKHLRILAVGFSFHRDMDEKLISPLVTQCRPLIETASRNSGRRCILFSPVTAGRDGSAYVQPLAALEQAGGTVTHPVTIQPGRGTREVTQLAQTKASECFSRGVNGAKIYEHNKKHKGTGRVVMEGLAALGLVVVLSPIIVPLYPVGFVMRRMRKGESWAALWHHPPRHR